uniref:Uncharacterized protein n=1 Tax=Arundo donax TaxID=35708 RepID=A0A0A8ZC34_ARUDO
MHVPIHHKWLHRHLSHQTYLRELLEEIQTYCT